MPRGRESFIPSSFRHGVEIDPGVDLLGHRPPELLVEARPLQPFEDRLLSPPIDAGAPAASATGRIEIALADGARVIVDREVDGSALARVLSVLGRR